VIGLGRDTIRQLRALSTPVSLLSHLNEDPGPTSLPPSNPISCYSNMAISIILVPFLAFAIWSIMVFKCKQERTEAKFLEVIGTKVLLFTVTSTNGFHSPSPPNKSGLKLVCNVNIVYGNLKSESSQDYAQKTQRNCSS
jgi:hypothetical protein